METIQLFVCWKSFQLGVSTNIFLEKWPCYFILPIRLAQFPQSYSKWRIFTFWMAFMSLYKAIIAENDTIMQFSLLMWRDGRFWTGWSSCLPSSMSGILDLWHSCKYLSWFCLYIWKRCSQFYLLKYNSQITQISSVSLKLTSNPCP